MHLSAITALLIWIVVETSRASNSHTVTEAAYDPQYQLSSVINIRDKRQTKRSKQKSGRDDEPCEECQVCKEAVLKDNASFPRDFTKYGEGCGHMFFLSNSQKNFDDAFNSCCLYGMDLINFETDKDLTCFAKIFDKGDAREMWSSARICSTSQTWKWCSSQQTVAAALISGADSSSAMCAIISKESQASAKRILKKENCKSEKFYFCKYPIPVVSLFDVMTKDCSEPVCRQAALNCSTKPVYDYAIVKDRQTDFRRLGIVCGRIYVHLSNFVTFAEAQEQCCKLGMTVLGVETEEERNCLAQLDKGADKMNVWSSATDEGCGKAWMWCGSRVMLDMSTPWLAGRPYTGDENCAYIKWSEGPSLVQTKCSNRDQISVVCEAAIKEVVTCDQPFCPSCKEPDKKVRLLNEEANNLVMLGKACDSLYFQSVKELSYDKAFQQCCRKGMRLLSFESPKQQECLQLLRNELKKKKEKFPILAKQSEYDKIRITTQKVRDIVDGFMESSSAVLWSSLSSEGCSNTWRWCSSNNNYMHNLRWTTSSKKTSRNLDFCATWKEPNYLDAVDCEEGHNVICEAPVSKMDCKKPTCPNTACSSTYIEEAFDSSFGLTLMGEGCGKLFYISTMTDTYLKAYQKCCVIGGKLLSLESKEKEKCISKFQSTRKYDDEQIWTSATDVGCEGTWGWCGVASSTFSATWLPSAPTDIYLAQNCAIFTMGEVLLLQDKPCNFPFKYICEVNKPPPPPAKKAACVRPICPENIRAIYDIKDMKITEEKSGLAPIYNLIKDEGSDFESYLSFARLGAFNNKVFYFSMTKMSHTEASLSCAELGLKLLTNEKSEDLAKLTALVQRHGIDMGLTWNSATNRGCEKTWQWCAAPELATWQGTVDKSSLCGVYNWKTSPPNLVTMKCSEPLNFVCKGVLNTTETANCTRPVCTNMTSCAKKPNSRSADAPIGMKVLGKPGESSCGSFFYMANIEDSYDAAMKKCCDFGFQLLSIDSKEKAVCMEKLITRQHNGKVLWTSGSNRGCKKAWQWCSAGSSFMMKNVTWATSQPDNKFDEEFCAAVSFTSPLELRDELCSDTFSYICEDRLVPIIEEVIPTTMSSVTELLLKSEHKAPILTTKQVIVLTTTTKQPSTNMITTKPKSG